MTPAQASSQGSLQVLVQMASSASRRHLKAHQGMRCWKKMKTMMLNSKSAMHRCVTMQTAFAYGICATQKPDGATKIGASDVATVYNIHSNFG